MIDDLLIDDPAGDDLLGVLARFAAALREAGVAASAGRTAIAAEALGHWGVAAGADPYWPLRVAFCSNEADLLRFDAVYRTWFRRPLPAEPAEPAEPADAGRPAPVPAGARTGGDEAGANAPAEDAGAGNTARLATRDFDDLTDEELREVSTWVELLRPVPLRHAARLRPARSGRIDPAPTMRTMLRNGGELLRVRRRRRVPRPRRVLLLVDVSASMRPYSDVLLRFAHAALRASPRTTEVFAVGTRHTHLTGALRAQRPELALPAAGRVKTDWYGGTTLGVALRDFLHRWGGSTVTRSAIVILASDGFEFRAPTLMITQVARLAALAHVFIWVDPACRTGDYQPVDRHVARAQGHATAVLGCHSYEALRELAKAITDV